MKRPPTNRAWPRQIVEIATSRPDSRADPQATQKISRAQLDEALKRTKSGTRRSVHSQHEIDELSGPRDDDAPRDDDDSPQITIVRIDSLEVDRLAELETVDPLSLPPAPSAPFVAPLSTPSTPGPLAIEASLPRSRGLPITPRTAFIAGVLVAVFVALAASLGFFAGRGIGGHP